MSAPSASPEPPQLARPPLDRGRILLAAAVLLLGTLGLRTGWAGWVAWLPLLVAGGAGLGLVIGLRKLGVHSVIVGLATVVVPALTLIGLGRGEDLSPLKALTDSLPMLLTSFQPAPPTPFLLGPGLVIAWAAGTVLGAGLERPGFVLPPLVAALLLLVTAELLTSARSDWVRLSGIALLGVLLRSWGPRTLRATVGAVGLAACALLVSLASLGPPFQARDAIETPVTAVAEPNPLPMLGQWARHPDVEILRRSGDGGPLHLVVLPDYTGVTFDSRSEYEPLDAGTPPLLPAGRDRVTRRTAIAWNSTTRWLPAPGMPTEVDLPHAIVDVDTGSLALPEPPNGPVSYVVTGMIEVATPAQLAGSDVGREPRYTDLPPNLPPDFVDYAREVTKDAPTYVEQARALERALQADRRFDSNAPGGTSIGRLHEFLFLPAAEGGRAGTSEQFAAAYAVLARSVGIPARVVVGFGSGEEQPDGTRIVRGRDALAWPEVYFVGHGWVPFNPTPDAPRIEQPAGPGTDSGDGTTAPSPSPTPPGSDDPPPSPPALPPDGPDGSGGGNGPDGSGGSGGADPGSGPPWAVLLPVLALTLLAALVTGLVLARRRRLLRQRLAGPLGAWEAIEDALLLAGRRLEVTRTASARAAQLGVPDAEAVATAAERAAFAPPGQTWWSGETVWPRAEGVIRRLRADANRLRRAVWAVNPLVWWEQRRGLSLPKSPRRGWGVPTIGGTDSGRGRGGVVHANRRHGGPRKGRAAAGAAADAGGASGGGVGPQPGPRG